MLMHINHEMSLYLRYKYLGCFRGVCVCGRLRPAVRVKVVTKSKLEQGSIEAGIYTEEEIAAHKVTILSKFPTLIFFSLTCVVSCAVRTGGSGVIVLVCCRSRDVLERVLGKKNSFNKVTTKYCLYFRRLRWQGKIFLGV